MSLWTAAESTSMASSVDQALLYLKHTDKATGRERWTGWLCSLLLSQARRKALGSQTLAPFGLNNCSRQGGSLLLNLCPSLLSWNAAFLPAMSGNGHRGSNTSYQRACLHQEPSRHNQDSLHLHITPGTSLKILLTKKKFHWFKSIFTYFGHGYSYHSEGKNQGTSAEWRPEQTQWDPVSKKGECLGKRKPESIFSNIFLMWYFPGT